MDRESVNSSSIASIGYDPTTMTLEVEFTTGFVYQYFDVPETEYRNLMAAESMGKHLNQQIKGNYRYSKI